ncbi:MAG: hypothetical protein LUQ20_05995 [Candidatus Methanoperedens sp.]|nr:hypothetical protein [Candidatus Methanoperedens sp.]
MTTDIVNIIVSLAVLIVPLEVSYRRIIDFENTYNRTLSNIAIAQRGGRINEEQHMMAAKEINEQFRVANRYIKWAALFKRFLPILLLVEILHITLKDIQWSYWYEWILPGLNNIFLTSIIIVILLYYIVKEFKLNHTKLNDYEANIISVEARYVYDFL